MAGKEKDNAEVKSDHRRNKAPWWRTLVHRFDPNRWSIKGRFLYLTGALLIMGNLFLIGYLYLIFGDVLERSAQAQLNLVRTTVSSQVQSLEGTVRSQAAALAEVPGVKASLAAGASEGMSDFLMAYGNNVRKALGLMTLDFELCGSEAQETEAATWMRNVGGETVLFARWPVQRGDTRVGCVITRCNVWEGLSKIDLPQGLGLALASGQAESALQILDQRGILSQGLDYKEASTGLAEGEGHGFGLVMPLGSGLWTVLSFDASGLNESRWNKINIFIWFFLGGALFMMTVLYLNVIRIERFFSRMKKIIISSHSNYFAERFESDNVHCLDVLHCHNEECPVYQNPSLTCYLETGSEAISPKWRDTCIFLNKYDSCHKCPVYTLRKGDELTEMRNVMNTMMRLWSEFLERVGHLLVYVLRSQGGSGAMPSLDEISERLEQMAKLTFFGRDVQGAWDKGEVYDQLGHVFTSAFGLPRHVLFEVDPETNRLAVALDGMPDDMLCKHEVLLSCEVCRASRVAEDVVSFYNPKLCPHFNCDLKEDVRVCMPVVMSGKVGAVVSFMSARRDWESLRAQIPILRKYLDEAGPVLSSLKLLKLSKEQALRDPLTHCHNRRFLDEFITKYEPLIDREERAMGLLMCDMDYFKQVNDEHGHEAGDAVLQQVVGIIEANIRRSDVLIRYGGEEFLALLQNVEKGSSEAVAEKIRNAVESTSFELPSGTRLHKTISVGVAEFPNDADGMYKAIKFADVALYSAKDGGRNKVVRFEPGMWTEESY
ncbi:MAG: GGDEF domain-containing protein [Proteobacteria bacterium]|nr:GGDEF domain-containing protein [Pseudomonadota bacterium]